MWAYHVTSSDEWAMITTHDSGGLTESDFAPGSALEHALGDTVDGALANNTYEHYVEHLPGLEAIDSS